MLLLTYGLEFIVLCELCFRYFSAYWTQNLWLVSRWLNAFKSTSDHGWSKVATSINQFILLFNLHTLKGNHLLVFLVIKNTIVQLHLQADNFFVPERSVDLVHQERLQQLFLLVEDVLMLLGWRRNGWPLWLDSGSDARPRRFSYFWWDVNTAYGVGTRHVMLESDVLGDDLTID